MHRLHVLRENAYAAFKRAVLYFRMTTRKPDALARVRQSFFYTAHRNSLTAVFERDFERQSHFRIRSDEFDSGKKPRVIEFARKSAYRETKKKSQPIELGIGRRFRNPRVNCRECFPRYFTIPRDPRKLIRPQSNKNAHERGDCVYRAL